MDGVYFAAAKKVDYVLINQRQVFQVPNDEAIAGFCAEQRFELAYVFCAHSTGEIEDRLSVRGPREEFLPLWTQSHTCYCNRYTIPKVLKINQIEVMLTCDFRKFAKVATTDLEGVR